MNLEGLANATMEEKLAESTYLATYTISKMLVQEKCDNFLASAFLLHTIIARNVPLSKRRLPLIRFDDDFQKTINNFLARFSFIARSVMDDPKWSTIMDTNEIESDTIDLVDGRLFRATIQSLCDESFNGILPHEFRQGWKVISNIVKKLSEIDLSLAGPHETLPMSVAVDDMDINIAPEELGVLAFSSTYSRSTISPVPNIS
jgi:hypothetical protein